MPRLASAASVRAQRRRVLLALALATATWTAAPARLQPTPATALLMTPVMYSTTGGTPCVPSSMSTVYIPADTCWPLQSLTEESAFAGNAVLVSCAANTTTYYNGTTYRFTASSVSSGIAAPTNCPTSPEDVYAVYSPTCHAEYPTPAPFIRYISVQFGPCVDLDPAAFVVTMDYTTSQNCTADTFVEGSLSGLTTQLNACYQTEKYLQAYPNGTLVSLTYAASGCSGTATPQGTYAVGQCFANGAGVYSKYVYLSNLTSLGFGRTTLSPTLAPTRPTASPTAPLTPSVVPGLLPISEAGVFGGVATALLVGAPTLGFFLYELLQACLSGVGPFQVAGAGMSAAQRAHRAATGRKAITLGVLGTATEFITMVMYLTFQPFVSVGLRAFGFALFAVPGLVLLGGVGSYLAQAGLRRDAPRVVALAVPSVVFLSVFASLRLSVFPAAASVAYAVVDPPDTAFGGGGLLDRQAKLAPGGADAKDAEKGGDDAKDAEKGGDDDDDAAGARLTPLVRFQIYAYNLSALGTSVGQGMPYLAVLIANETELLMGGSDTSTFGVLAILSILSTGAMLVANVATFALAWHRKPSLHALLRDDHFGFATFHPGARPGAPGGGGVNAVDRRELAIGAVGIAGLTAAGADGAY